MSKSLGEKLCDAIWQPLMYVSRAPWNMLGLDSRASYEVAALAFAASLSHDETATATIEGLRGEVATLQDKVEGLTCDLRMAVETAYHRGATEWTRLNYPHIYAHLNPQEARNAE